METELSQDTEALKGKVLQILNWLYQTKYGVSKVPTIHNRWIYENIGSAKDDVMKIMNRSAKSNEDKIKAFKIVVEKVYEMFPGKMPSPGLFGLELRRAFELEKRQNTEVDCLLEKGKMQTQSRIKCKADHIEKYGDILATKMESDWLFLHGMADMEVFRLDFWGAAARQDKEALAIINSYEQRPNRKTDRKCDT